MDSDEKDICLYLKGWPGIFISHREIAWRAAGKARYRDDPNWACAALARLVEQRILESDSTGHFRLKAPQPKEPPKRWVSAQIQRIFEQGGKTFEVEDQSEEPI